jgi:Fibronectin type III-like domain
VAGNVYGKLSCSEAESFWLLATGHLGSSGLQKPGIALAGRPADGVGLCRTRHRVLGEPGSRLVTFGQAYLKPGQSRQMDLTIDADSAQHPLSYWAAAIDNWARARGGHTVNVSTSADSPVLTGHFVE